MAIEQNNNELMKIRMIKEFVIEYKNERICMNDIAPRQMMNLLAILVYQRRKPINKDKLIELLWQENENPLNVMKFSIFRLRTFLKEQPVLADLDLIITTKKGYEFNQEIPVEIDVEMIEDCWQQMNLDSKTNLESIKKAKIILEYYKGKFLEGSTEDWMLHIQSYLQNIYQRTFELYANHLLLNKNYDELIEVAHRAISIDAFHEEAYYYYIDSLIENQLFNKALTAYKDVQKLFFEEFGSPLSLKLRSLYNVIIAKDEEDEMDINTLKDKLTIGLKDEGAFYCEYELFRHIFQVELRNSVRENRLEFLVVFEIHIEGSEKEQLVYMDKLKKVIHMSLRKGDVFSRMNKIQYVLLIPCKNVESAHMVIHRITSAYYRKVSKERVKLHYYLSTLSELSQLENNL
ncbi:MAG: BTAD domain-containing putative transcriptional regulator [Erysipelotrichaceae bacterium]